MPAEIPSPPSLPLIGHAHYLLTGAYKNLNRLAKELGPIFQLQIGGKKVIYISSLSLIKEVADESRFNKYLGKAILTAREVLEDGLITAWTDEPNWGKAHRILLPAFTQNAMSDHLSIMDSIIKEMLSKWSHLPPNEYIDMSEEMRRLALDVIGVTGFDFYFNSFVAKELHPFLTDLTEAVRDIQMTAYMPKFLRNLRYFKNAKQKKRIENLSKTIEKTLLDRAKDSEVKDFLNTMLKNKDKVTGCKLDARNIKNQILSFLVAGFETTRSLLAFSFYYLVTNPKVMNKAIMEVDAILGNDTDITPSLQQLLKLEYVQQILQESLRLGPPVPYISRFALQDTLLEGKYEIKSTDWIWLLIPNLHRSKEVWGENADEFDPERFSRENKIKIDPDAFIPFGIGQRSCIGRQFALTESILAIARVIQRFSLSLKENVKLEYEAAVTLSTTSLFMKVQKRVFSTKTPFQSKTVILPEKENIKLPTKNENIREIMEENNQIGNKNLENDAMEKLLDASASQMTTLVVLYGSNTGTSEGIAKRIQRDGLSLGFRTDLFSLDEGIQLLPKKGNFFIITSTYNGFPPDNASKFNHWLQSLDPINKPLEGINFTIFGCGNTQWRTYQAFPIFVQKKMIELGAVEIYPRGEVDGDLDDEEVFERWYQEYWPVFSKNIDSNQVMRMKELEEECVPLEFILQQAPDARPLFPVKGDVFEILINNELQSLQKNESLTFCKSTRHIELKLPSSLTYQTGDYFTVMPQNGRKSVNRVFARFKLDPELYIKINGNQQTFLPTEKEYPLLELLEKSVELTEPATRRHIKILARYTSCPPDLKSLQQLAEDPYYKDQIIGCKLSILDLLDMHPSCDLPFAAYLSLLPPLRMRYYSISSSPNKTKNSLSLTVGVHQSQFGNSIYQGVCSNYLASKYSGEHVFGQISQQKKFKLPDDLSLPLILVCAGTGIAPFRGFLQEREQLCRDGKQVEKAYLFFGLRDLKQDFLYQNELITLQEKGIVEIYLAPSRSVDHPKRYVQDKLVEKQELIWKLIQEGAIIYVCGDALRMAPAVQNAFETIYMVNAQASHLETKAWISECFNRNKYHVDAWLSSPSIGPSL